MKGGGGGGRGGDVDDGGAGEEGAGGEAGPELHGVGVLDAAAQLGPVEGASIGGIWQQSQPTNLDTVSCLVSRPTEDIFGGADFQTVRLIVPRLVNNRVHTRLRQRFHLVEIPAGANKWREDGEA